MRLSKFVKGTLPIVAVNLSSNEWVPGLKFLHLSSIALLFEGFIVPGERYGY